jgi:hypothetical protein
MCGAAYCCLSLEVRDAAARPVIPDFRCGCMLSKPAHSQFVDKAALVAIGQSRLGSLSKGTNVFGKGHLILGKH